MLQPGTFINSFGPIAYLLILTSIVIITIVIERLITFFLLPKFPITELSKLIESIKNKKNTDGQPILKEPFANWINVLLEYSPELAETELSLALAELRNKLQKPLEWLNLFAVAAPMLGLLGTIWSMSHSFAVLGKNLSSGGLGKMIEYLSEAMYATAFGIVLALASMIGLYILRHKSDKYLDACQLNFNRISLAIQQAKTRGNNDD